MSESGQGPWRFSWRLGLNCNRLVPFWLATCLAARVCAPCRPFRSCGAVRIAALRRAQYPKTSAILGTAYLASRLAYWWGYSTGKPINRLIGLPSHFCKFGLTAMCLKAGWHSVRKQT